MSTLDHLPHPTRCFCRIPEDKIKKWAIERYIHNRSTVDLLASVTDPREKEAISVVALLDADDDTLLQMMGNVDRPNHHILHCREVARKMVRQLQAEIGDDPVN